MAAALRSWRIQLIDDATTIEIEMKVANKPKPPAKGVTATTIKLAATAVIAPSKSGNNCLGIGFQGLIGFGIAAPSGNGCCGLLPINVLIPCEPFYL
ncbi:unannotated protein [freshwater metagenome]|uniref:Unannotated protein n=1 Tax=freshwater metagenome TaxID=449393 RepID=A0A6J6EA04_9ZZZZ